jgi:TonB-dependent SusC/RagA subfamily outer membrane receptor
MKKLTASVLSVVLTASFTLVSAQKDSIKTQEIEGVVVTALGIKREKKSLGYATQGVSGEDISDKPLANFANALQGEVAGLNVQSYGTMGGSANMVIRGYSSISGNNQALVVVDGVPILNANTNTSGQKTGRGGYDYGNAAMDINPDDIESVNVLKGAAATALYGSRAGQGAIIITTKKGKNKKGIGISFNSSVTFGNADKSTLPVYQNKYGAGYGPYYKDFGSDTDLYFNNIDINGDGILDQAVPFTEDASYGAAFDPNLLVYQWNSIYPQLPTYGQKMPWVAGKHTPNDIFQTAFTTQNSISFGQNFDGSDFRVGFTNLMQTGILPNSELKRNSFTFNGTHSFTDKFKMGTGMTFTRTNGKGRYGTGYDGANVMQAFRQWWQTNVDIYQQRDAYFSTKQNITWNPNSYTNLKPIYTDNPYWILYENYQTDQRDRYFGNIFADYKINDWFSLTARFSRDAYTEKREERIAIGSANVSSYSLFNNTASEPIMIL